MLQENQLYLKFKMKFNKLISRILCNSTHKYLIDGFFKEVVDDIKILKEDMLINTPNPFVNYIYDEYEINPIVKNTIKEKYEKRYCPTFLFDYFNQSEKMNYIILRIEIDKLLGIKDSHYEI